MRVDNLQYQTFLLVDPNEKIDVVSQNNICLLSTNPRHANKFLKYDIGTPFFDGKAKIRLRFPIDEETFPNFARRSEIWKLSKDYGFASQNLSVVSLDGNFTRKYRTTDLFWALYLGLVALENGIFQAKIPFGVPVKFLGRYKMCVCCGMHNELHEKAAQKNKSNRLTKHHIVPRAYTKCLPEKYYNFPHDIVYVCVRCHNKAESRLKLFKTQLGELCSCPYTTHFADINSLNHKLYTKALLYERTDSPFRKEEYSNTLKELLGKEEITDEDIDSCLLLETSTKVEGLHHYEEVAAYWESKGIQEFFKMCREYFLKTMRPLYMPADFDVNIVR